MKRKVLYAILGVVLVVAAAVGLMAWRSRSTAMAEEDIRSTVVKRGTMLVAVSASGSVEPLERVGLAFEVPGLVLAQFTVVVALATRLLKSTFDMIDRRYVSVARVLGCTGFQAFRKVTLPLARPGILAAILLTWARAVGEYGASVTLAGATSMKTETLPIAIYLSFATADVEKAVAVIFILIVIAATALLALRWMGSKGIER